MPLDSERLRAWRMLSRQRRTRSSTGSSRRRMRSLRPPAAESVLPAPAIDLKNARDVPLRQDEAKIGIRDRRQLHAPEAFPRLAFGRDRQAPLGKTRQPGSSIDPFSGQLLDRLDQRARPADQNRQDEREEDIAEDSLPPGIERGGRPH